jgi:probable rRNA maturation factor
MKAQPRDRGSSMPVVNVLIESSAWDALPDCADVVQRAIMAAASHLAWQRNRTEVIVLLCDDGVIAGLNAQWRGISRPTNVLSFPPAPWTQIAPDREIPLGDIAIAYETVAREAAAHSKTVLDHCSHLVVHGFLHLLGYDHQTDADAERLERLERDILARIGIADPYASEGKS